MSSLTQFHPKHVGPQLTFSSFLFVTRIIFALGATTTGIVLVNINATWVPLNDVGCVHNLSDDANGT